MSSSLPKPIHEKSRDSNVTIRVLRVIFMEELLSNVSYFSTLLGPTLLEDQSGTPPGMDNQIIIHT